MLNKLLLINVLAISSCFGVTILCQSNWDGIDDLNDGNNGASVTPVVGPAGSNGNVAAIDLSGGNVWGAVNPPDNTLDIPAASVAGVDTFTATFRVYIPSTTTFTEQDRVNLIVRRNNTNGGGNAYVQNAVWNTLAPDTWHTLSISETIPEFETDGVTPVTGFTPILSFYDRTDGANTPAGAGIAAYVDDFSFSVTTSIPEPSTGLVVLLGAGLLGFRRQR
jgi:hypothetical protein